MGLSNHIKGITGRDHPLPEVCIWRRSSRIPGIRPIFSRGVGRSCLSYRTKSGFGEPKPFGAGVQRDIMGEILVEVEDK
jgi:hypothetical protein